MRINLSFPCNEDLRKMTDTAGGKFCAQCSKEVIDFTTWEKENIVAYLSKQKSCGIFKKEQLDTIKSKKIEPTPLVPQLTMLKRAAASVALLSVALFSCVDGDINAQNTITEGTSDKKEITNCNPQIMGRVAVKDIEIIDTTDVLLEMGEAVSVEVNDTIMGNGYEIPPIEPQPLMGIPAINPNDRPSKVDNPIKEEE